ncbi:MAG TPA: hypothetical protein VLT47_05620 [Anaeromyxobacteraceae bacterium]|nr:hypothetical protein [Anaeromyxobacteraceae bacterium]
MRDRRWDYLYERQKQPVREYVLERFAEHLAGELQAWPPPFVEWVSDDLRARYAEGTARRPGDDVFRFALALARLDLAREYDAYEHRLVNERARHWPTSEDEAAGHLLVLLLTEQCLELKEHAAGAHLARADLVRALDLVERRLFRVTLA